MLPIMALQRHERPVQSIAILQDSVFTGSEDTEIKVGQLVYMHMHVITYRELCFGQKPPYLRLYIKMFFSFLLQVFRHFKL